MQLALTLDAEFKRVAREEQKSMDDLVTEVAALTGKCARQLYNFRSGKWDLPSSLIPLLCRRFRSRALLDALIDECRGTEVEVPDLFDLTRLISRTVGDDMRHFESYIRAFEDGIVSEQELRELRESGERLISDVRKFEAIAVEDFERRRRLQSAAAER